jgi:hypothetical protein
MASNLAHAIGKTFGTQAASPGFSYLREDLLVINESALRRLEEGAGPSEPS